MRVTRAATYVLIAASFALVPWTLWLTFSLPAEHLTRHYDIAWVGFDIALAGALGGGRVARSPN